MLDHTLYLHMRSRPFLRTRVEAMLTALSPHERETLTAMIADSAYAIAKDYIQERGYPRMYAGWLRTCPKVLLSLTPPVGYVPIIVE